MIQRRHTLIICVAVLTLLLSSSLYAQADQPPDIDDSFPGIREGVAVPQEPHILQAFLPEEALGSARVTSTTSVDQGMPTAAARYGSGRPGVTIRIVHLWGVPGERYLADLRRRAQDAEAATAAIGPFSAFFFEERTRVTMALLIDDRYMVESIVTGGAASTSSARRAMEGVDIERLRTLFPQTSGLQSYDFVAAGAPVSLDYPAEWLLLDSTGPREATPTVLITRLPKARPEFLDPDTRLALGDNAAILVSVFASVLSGEPQELLRTIQAVYPYALAEPGIVSAPQASPAYGDRAATATFVGTDANESRVLVRTVIYQPGSRTAQVQIVYAPDAPREVTEAFEIVVRSLTVAQ